MKRILVTGAGGVPSTNFIRSLRMAPEKFYIVGTDADLYYLQRAETDKKYLVPRVDDPHFLEIIQSIIKKEKIEFVHVQNDTEVAWFSDYRDEIDADMFLPSSVTIDICQNKFASFACWRRADLQVPKTLTISSHDDIEKAFKMFGKTIWIRTRRGAAGKGSLRVSSIDKAISWIDYHEGWGDFTAASALSPNSTTWMSLWHHGKLIVAQGRKRLYWEHAKIAPSGITGVTGTGESIRDEKVDDIAQKAILAIDTQPHGLFGVDLCYDDDGIPNPTEINIGRFFTTHHFFTEAGLNMPYMYIQLAYGKQPDVPKPKINPLPPGLLWIRGMDMKPVLTTRKKLETYEDTLKKTKKKLET